MQFFSQIATERLPIFGDSGFWVEVKADLDAGDTKKLSLSALRHARQDKSGDEPVTVFDVDMEIAAFNKVAIYLVAWNVTDNNGKAVDIGTKQKKIDALKALTPAVYEEIERVIDEHAKSRQEKKAPAA